LTSKRCPRVHLQELARRAEQESGGYNLQVTEQGLWVAEQQSARYNLRHRPSLTSKRCPRVHLQDDSSDLVLDLDLDRVMTAVRVGLEWRLFRECTGILGGLLRLLMDPCRQNMNAQDPDFELRAIMLRF
jgi:hypothetical protein